VPDPSVHLHQFSKRLLHLLRLSHSRSTAPPTPDFAMKQNANSTIEWFLAQTSSFLWAGIINHINLLILGTDVLNKYGALLDSKG